MNITDKISNAVKFTLNEATRKIKRESKRVIIRLLFAWLIWLILAIVLFAIIGGLFAGTVVVISAIAFLVYSIISVITKTKIATARITMEIPLDIATGLLHEIAKDTDLDPDKVSEVKSKVLEIIKNPSILIFSPNKIADTVKELSDAINCIVKT